MLHQAAAAYQKTRQATVDPRELEASLLLKAAARIQSVIDNWENGRSDLREALFYNRKLWTVFVSSATSDSNHLPENLKQNVANLGIFIFNQTIEIELNPQKEKLGILVSINKNLAEGLRGR